jgi:drug/metabolite transporter (DMT)-like permease
MTRDRLGQAAFLPMILALGTAWGAAFVFIKVLVEDISPTEIVAGRMPLAALAVLAVVLLAGRRIPSRPNIIAATALLAVLDSVIPYTLVGWSETRIDAGMSSVLISTMPIFTVVFAAVFLRERLRGLQVAGIGLGIVGVAIVAQADAIALSDGKLVAALVVIGAAASYGVSTVLASNLLRSEDALGLTGLKLALGSVIAIAISLAIDGAPGYSSLGAGGWASLITLGIVCTGMAFAGFFWIIGRAGPVYASLSTFVIPVAGLLIGWLALGENIAPLALAGIPVVAAGLAAVKYDRQLAAVARDATRWAQCRTLGGAYCELPAPAVK